MEGSELLLRAFLLLQCVLILESIDEECCLFDYTKEKTKWKKNL